MKAVVRALVGAVVAAAAVPAMADLNFMNQTGEQVCFAWATTRSDCAMLSTDGSSCLQQGPWVQDVQGWKCANDGQWTTIPNPVPTIVVARYRNSGDVVPFGGLDTRLRVRWPNFRFNLSWFGGSSTATLNILQPSVAWRSGSWSDIGDAFDRAGFYEMDAMSFGTGNFNYHLD